MSIITIAVKHWVFVLKVKGLTHCCASSSMPFLAASLAEEYLLFCRLGHSLQNGLILVSIQAGYPRTSQLPLPAAHMKAESSTPNVQ